MRCTLPCLSPRLKAGSREAKSAKCGGPTLCIAACSGVPSVWIGLNTTAVSTVHRMPEEVLIEANNGLAYLSQVRGTTGHGHVYLLGTNLETGNLTRHGLFVPTLLRAAESSRQTEGRRYLLGRDQAMTLQDASATSRETDVAWSVVQLHPPAGQPEVKVVPEVRTTPEGLRLGWGSALPFPGPMRPRKMGPPWLLLGSTRAAESQLTCWLPEEWTQELVSLGWEDIPVWTQPAAQVARMVEQHIAGERLAWYFSSPPLWHLCSKPYS